MSDKTDLERQAWSAVDVGDVVQAVRLFDALCAVQPDDPEAWTMSGALHLEAGERVEARERLMRAIELDPEYADPWMYLGKLELAESRTEDALVRASRACQLDANYLEAWVLLATCHAMSKQFDEAGSAVGRALSLEPGHVMASQLRMQIMRDEAAYWSNRSDWDRACACYQRFLETYPTDARAHNDLGNIWLALSKYGQAEAAFRQALALSKNALPEAWSNLGQILQQQGRLSEAVAAYDKAVVIQPDNPSFCLNLAMGLQATGDFERALSRCDQAILLEPSLDRALVGKADILQKMGRYQESWDVLQAHGLGNTSRVEVVLLLAKAAAHLDAPDQALAAAQALLSRPGLSLREQQQVHAVLGDLHDKKNDFNNAFLHYQASNLIKLKNARFNPERHRNLINRLQSVFSGATLEAFHGWGDESELPIFIVGMPRSGTSLVEQILASHPQVHGAGELDWLQTTANRLATKTPLPSSYPECLPLLGSRELKEAASEYLGDLAYLGPGALRVTDKMPHNFLHLGLVQVLLPRARVIHVVRDPVDVCLSCFFQDFSATHSYACDLEQLGHYYLEYMRVMRHWSSVLSVSMLEVRYEELVENQESVTRQMVDFCGLDWNESTLHFHETKRNVATPSYDQVRRPMYRKSMQRWKNYEQHLEPLLEVLGDIVKGRT
jgi:tetratricopeptide (TPR) repeat protein